MNPTAFALIETAAALDGIAPEWDALYAASRRRHACLAFPWVRATFLRQAQRRGRRPAVVVGRRDGCIVLLWPLVVFRSRLWRVCRGLSEDMADFDDMLCRHGPEAEALCRGAWAHAVAALRPHMMMFRRVPAGAGLDRAIPPAASNWQRPSASPCALLGGADGRRAARPDVRLRADLRRKRRLLEQAGPVRFGEVAEGSARDAAIAWAFARKHERLGAAAHSRREKTEHAAFGNLVPFYVEQAQADARAGGMRVLRLAAGEATVAVSTVRADGRRAVGWLYGYDETFARASPGLLAVAETLAWARSAGFRIFDMMPEPEPYKRKWAACGYRVRDVRVATGWWGRPLLAWHRSSLRGMALAVYMRAPRPVQAAVRRLFR
ncbi:MAG: GNAT family N-acetyltransferase [Alphaproteobacteria bacterium]